MVSNVAESSIANSADQIHLQLNFTKGRLNTTRKITTEQLTKQLNPDI
jgi:competence protein ComGF